MKIEKVSQSEAEVRGSTSSSSSKAMSLLQAAVAVSLTASAGFYPLRSGAQLLPRAPRCISMLVDAVESTPNPSAFLLRLSAPLEGIATDALRGQTFRRDRRCPPALASALETEGVESIFVCAELLTVSKTPSVAWDAVLPKVIEALGGSSEKLAASGLPKAGGVEKTSSASGGVTIRLQVSQKLPIQVEAIGWSGANPPSRAKLSARFSDAMGTLIGQSGDAFFAGRQWLDRGIRYPELEIDDEDPIGSERSFVAAALETELAEVEAAYPDDRLASIVDGSKAKSRERVSSSSEASVQIDLQDVDRLCDEDAADEAAGGSGMNEALAELSEFVTAGGGQLGARRNAIAYLGGTAGRGGDAVFAAIERAFKSEKAAGMRRTAGDALSDLGDTRAAPLAAAALADKSTLVRWRAARILGELGEGPPTVAALKQASFEEKAFEVAFEMKDAARKVARRDAGEEGAAKGPIWKQIQEGAGLQ